MPPTYNPKTEIEKLRLELVTLTAKYENQKAMLDVIVGKFLTNTQLAAFNSFASNDLETRLKKAIKDFA